MNTHRESHPDGTTQGRDPRQMTAADFAEIGIERTSRGDAIRAKCLDCVYTPAEVRRCADRTCALWPFRMGTDPFREARTMSEEQKAAAVERLARGRAQQARG